MSSTGAEGSSGLGLNVLLTVPATVGGEISLVAAGGSVIDFEGDAIVNAANEGGVNGGGVDGAINSAGGSALLEARRALPLQTERQVRIPCGTAVITSGKFGRLRCDHIVHAVGPNYHMRTDREGDQLLQSAYASAVETAAAAGCETLCFSLISCGIFAGNRGVSNVLELGVKAAAATARAPLREIYFAGYSKAEQLMLVDILKTVVPREVIVNAEKE
eukprot:UC1_evm5s2143